jgi:hypothetical protein
MRWIMLIIRSGDRLVREYLKSDVKAEEGSGIAIFAA